MENNRRLEQNKIREKIKQILKYIETDKATIYRFRGQKSTVSYNIAQIAKLEAKNAERQLELQILEQRSRDIESGSLDEEMNKEAKLVKMDIDRKTDETSKKKDQDKADKAANNVLSVAYYQAGKKEDRKIRYDDKSVAYSYKHFRRSCDSIPEYMLKKLKNMPNNKGYIWKSVHCYGDRPANKGESNFLYETQRNGLRITYETTDYEYKIWHAKDKQRKFLFSTEPRKKKCSSGASLMDYVK